eukprot:6200018-Pleurochrysis_carterae.AAC.2
MREATSSSQCAQLLVYLHVMEKETGLSVSTWCHQCAGKKSASPSSSTIWRANGSASAVKRGKIASRSARGAHRSTRERRASGWSIGCARNECAESKWSGVTAPPVLTHSRSGCACAPSCRHKRGTSPPSTNDDGTSALAARVAHTQHTQHAQRVRVSVDTRAIKNSSR